MNDKLLFFNKKKKGNKHMLWGSQMHSVILFPIHKVLLSVWEFKSEKCILLKHLVIKLMCKFGTSHIETQWSWEWRKLYFLSAFVSWLKAILGYAASCWVQTVGTWPYEGKMENKICWCWVFPLKDHIIHYPR